MEKNIIFLEKVESKGLLKKYNKNFLGKIPIDPDVGKAADKGKPLVEENHEHKISKVYLELAKKIKSSFH